MPKVKVVFGINFSISPSATNEELELYYSQKVKPFIASLFTEKSVKCVVHFCGTILEFIDKKHKETIIAIKELNKEKRIEFLVSGFYEPILQFIDSPYVTSQIDKLKILITNIVRKKAKGFWLTNGVWEPSFPSILDKANIKYSFLSDVSFKYSGVDVASLFQIFITEDKGKTVLLFPIIESLSNAIGKVDVNEYFDNLLGLSETNKDNIVSVFIDNKEVSPEWLGDFFSLVKDNKNIDFYLPNALIRRYEYFKKVYIPATCDSNNAGKMFYNGQRESYELAVKKFYDSDIINMINRGSFRNFLTKYIEANRIYSRVKITTEEMRFIKDKSLKREALPFLLKAQTSYALSFNSDLGIYNPKNRQYCYKNLINVEKIVREKGQIQNYIKKYDFNNDGLEEVIFTGNHLKAFISKKGASLFELDYYPLSYNYLNTICDYSENYYSENGSDRRKVDTFQDILIYTDENGKEYIKDLSDDIFEILDIKSKRNIVRFKSVVEFPDGVTINLIKQYTMKKNTVEVLYTYLNLSDKRISLQIISEINLSFFDYKKSVEVYNCNDKEVRIKSTDKVLKNCNRIKFIDLYNKALINLFFSNITDVSHNLFCSSVMLDEKLNNICQFTSFKPMWSISLEPNKYWNNDIKLNIIKH